MKSPILQQLQNYLTGIKHIKNNLTVNKIKKVPYTQDTKGSDTDTNTDNLFLD